MSEMTQTVTGATQPQSDDASRITARDLRSVFWRSFTLQGSWNYERQQHMGYAFAMSPALKRIYQDPTELGRALQRHLVLFNTTTHLSTFIFGLSIAMEEENQRNPEFNEESINAIKTSLMGPLVWPEARLPGGYDLADENLPKRPYGPGDLYRINCWPHGRRRDDRQHDRYHHPAQLYRRADHHEGAGVY